MPSTPLELAFLCVLVFAAALLYSSGGHAGASAYLAIMALFGVSPAAMRPTALVMNIAVATIGTVRFVRVRAVPWHLIRPLCLGSIPAAFLGGRVKLAPGDHLLVLGVVLLVASVFLWLRPKIAATRVAPPAGELVAIGATLGFVAGLTGIGGGIFLSPLLLLTGWEEPRKTSGAAAVFILANSLLGLVGQLSSLSKIPQQAPVLAVVAMSGGVIGSWLGAHRLNPLALRRVHSLVVLSSGVKLIFDGIRLR
jgi:uncharacterized membrane protein YfcA